MAKDFDYKNFDINDFIVEDNELSIFEEAVANCIRDWQESKKDPLQFKDKLKCEANELLAVAQSPIPAWKKVKTCPFVFHNGIYETPMGKVLVQGGYFIMLEDLKYLPREEGHL